MLIILGIIILSIIVTSLYYQYKIKKLPVCRFNNACTKFNEKDTAEAIQRITQLIIKEQGNTKKFDEELKTLLAVKVKSSKFN